jgi:histidine ammonia-lyase
MINAARALADRVDAEGFAAKVQGGPVRDEDRTQFLAEVDGLRKELADDAEFGPGPAIAAAHAAIRTRIACMDRDRALDGDVAMAVKLVERNVVLDAVRGVLSE